MASRAAHRPRFLLRLRAGTSAQESSFGGVVNDPQQVPGRTSCVRGFAMAARYRLYCLNAQGRISMAEWIDAADDRDAIRQARALNRDAQKCEIWEGKRLVARLDSQDLAAA